MRLITIFFTFLLLKSAAQPPINICKQITEIAQAEQQRHDRLDITGPNEILTAASNFDAKYYRCEWEVDPAVRFIKGKITVYYTVLASGTSIALDIMSPLVVDSVTQRNIVLAKQQANNILQINFASTINAGFHTYSSIHHDCRVFPKKVSE